MALLASLGPGLARGAEPGFTTAERRALAEGRLVSRPLRDPARAGLVGGSSWQVIAAPRGVVWQALHDVARYPNMLPGVVDARQVAGGPDRTIVYLRQGHWPIYTSHYVVVRSSPRDHSLRFHVDPNRPHGVRDGVGYLQLVAYGAERTLLAFTVKVDLGRGIVASVESGIVQAWMLKLPSTVKHFLESGGGNLYRAAAVRDGSR